MITGQNYQQPYPQYYPTSYPQYQQQILPSSQPMQQQQNQVLFAWVQSEEEGTKFPLSAGQSIFLMNQNDDYLYMKSIDQLGKMTFIKKRLIDETDDKEPKIDLSGYIRKDELETLICEKIQEEVERRVSEISFKPTKAKRKYDIEED